MKFSVYNVKKSFTRIHTFPGTTHRQKHTQVYKIKTRYTTEMVKQTKSNRAEKTENGQNLEVVNCTFFLEAARQRKGTIGSLLAKIEPASRQIFQKT